MTYCFKCDCGKAKQVAWLMSRSAELAICECGETMYRDFHVEQGRHKDTPNTYPFASAFAGVHPDDMPAIRKNDADSGVPTDYTHDGDPIFTSKSHRKKYFRLHGLYDRNAGYSDPAPVNR